jgi:hypothetical protein
MGTGKPDSPQFPIIPVVGGIAGCLCLMALVAFFVVRRRQRQKRLPKEAVNGSTLTPMQNPMVHTTQWATPRNQGVVALGNISPLQSFQMPTSLHATQPLFRKETHVAQHIQIECSGITDHQPVHRHAMQPLSTHGSRLSDMSVFQTPIATHSSRPSKRLSIKQSKPAFHKEELQQVRPQLALIKKTMQPVRAADSGGMESFRMTGFDMYNKRRSLRF